jgi:Flp pilus assembly pilin Flp
MRRFHELLEDDRAAALPETAYLIAFLSLGVLGGIGIMMGSIDDLVDYLGKTWTEAI